MSTVTPAAKLLVAAGVAIALLSLLVRPAIPQGSPSLLADTASIIVGVLMVITGLVAMRIDLKRTQRREEQARAAAQARRIKRSS